MQMSPKRKIATYAVAATAVVSGGVGTLLTVMASGANAAPGITTGRAGVARVDDVAIAAQALGIDVTALRTELAAGKSISQVATEKGLDVQAAIDAITAADTKAIDDAVAAGTLTEAAAAGRKANLAAHIQAEVDEVGLRGGGKGGHRGGGGNAGSRGVARVDDVAIAAQALGIDTATLKAELAAGKSISQVATEKGLDVQAAIDAIIAADTEAIDDAVAAGKLTQAAAEARKADLPAHVEAEVERVGFKGGGKRHGRHAPSTGTAPSATTTS